MAMTKTLDEYFLDWESHVFGFGYGTGEEHTLPALIRFFELCRPDGSYPRYNYEELERELGSTVAWLLINILGHADVIEYGSSPRFGWLSNAGTSLKIYLAQKTNDEVFALYEHQDENYVHCYPNACNCGPTGYKEGLVCENPFWHEKLWYERADNPVLLAHNVVVQSDEWFIDKLIELVDREHRQRAKRQLVRQLTGKPICELTAEHDLILKLSYGIEPGNKGPLPDVIAAQKVGASQ